jgi:outer membrane lipoprotein-sorting protein
MFKYFIIIFFLNFITSANADYKEKILNKLKNTRNINFDFEQNINGKIETGNCIIEYPKKIFCEYDKANNKVLVSNGKSLVIKTISSYYRYPIQRTPLDLILDKKFLINKISNLDERIIDKYYINYQILENDNEISIFFDNQTFNLVGWQTKDIYQNLSITFISSVKTNEFIDKKFFKLPSQN